MLIIRNLLFWLVFVIVTLIFFFLFIVGSLLLPKIRHTMGVAWARIYVYLLKVFIGLDYEVKGSENIPQEPSIICCKHQSGYETLVLQLIFPYQVFVLKKELFYIPIVGWGLMLMSPIAINRQDRVKANQQILEQGNARKKKGFWITIFPEGTRIAPGKIGRYKHGAARMATMLEMNLVPVAMNSGEFWPKNSFLKYPGKVTFVIGDTIKWDTGSIDELTNQCANWIEAEQRKIEGQGPCFKPVDSE